MRTPFSNIFLVCLHQLKLFSFVLMSLILWCAPSGQMDTTCVRCLVNSISRFIHLISCQTRKCMPIEKDYHSMVMVLKHLKPVLDEVVDYKIPSDDVLHKECEELDMTVNEAREFIENWCSKMSKICSVRNSWIDLFM